MALFTDSTAQSILGLLFGDVTYSPAAQYYVGVSTTAYNHDGTGGTEPTDSAYQRVNLPNSNASFNAATTLTSGGAQVTNAAQIQFPTSTQSWGTAVELGLYTGSSGGTPIAVASVAAQAALSSALASGTAYTTLSVQPLTKAIASGDTLVIGTGATTQTVTASGAAAVGATSIPVNSFTANAAYAVGTIVTDTTTGVAVAANSQLTFKTGQVQFQLKFN